MVVVVVVVVVKLRCRENKEQGEAWVSSTGQVAIQEW